MILFCSSKDCCFFYCVDRILFCAIAPLIPTPDGAGEGRYAGATHYALQVGDVDQFQFRWEDLPGGGDSDYDDAVVSVDIMPDELFI